MSNEDLFTYRPCSIKGCKGKIYTMMQHHFRRCGEHISRKEIEEYFDPNRKLESDGGK
jgi:hypothetical protein